MHLKATDPNAENYLCINRKTRNCILRVTEANDETGEYTVLNLTGEAVPFRDKESKLWESSQELAGTLEWIGDKPVLDTTTKVGDIKLVHKSDTEGILKALNWFFDINDPDVTLRWENSELDPSKEELRGWSSKKWLKEKDNADNQLPTDLYNRRQEVEQNSNT